MQPEINNTTFGSIEVAGTNYDHDIIIRINGTGKQGNTSVCFILPVNCCCFVRSNRLPVFTNPE